MRAAFVLALALGAAPAAARSCERREARVDEKGFTVRVLRYGQETPAERAVLVMPPTGGTNVIDRSYARRLCKAGFDVSILEGWTGDDEYALDLGVHQRFYERAQRAIAAVLAASPARFHGLLGTSVGGIHAAVAASAHERLHAVFVVTAGAPISRVIVDSDQQAMRDAKRLRRERLGFKDDEEYRKALDARIRLDPFKLPPRYKGKRLGMAVSPADTTVPYSTQKALQELWSPARVIVVGGGHMGSIVRTWLFHSDEIEEFFRSASEPS